MKYQNLKQKAIALRIRGFSLKEISEILSISKSTASVWLRDVQMSKLGLNRLSEKIFRDRNRGIRIIKNQRNLEDNEIKSKCKTLLKDFKESLLLNKIFCSLLYWCEGGKTESAVYFTNSDPILVKYFLRLFRNSFDVNEKKFKVCLHLHFYHNEKRQKIFWSKITNIPINQFLKVYKKVNTAKNKKRKYQGCVSIRYYDYRVLKEMKYIIEYLI